MSEVNPQTVGSKRQASVVFFIRSLFQNFQG